MQDTNFWFYTLSAIPQTLAAMIALAATFVVFKLNFIQEKIGVHRRDLARFITLLIGTKEIHEVEPLNDEDFFELFSKSLDIIDSQQPYIGLNQPLYERFKEEMDRVIKEDWRGRFEPTNERICGYLYAKRNMFESLLSTKRTNVKLLGWSLGIAALVIAVSLAALPNYNYFKIPETIIKIFLIAAVVSVFLTAYSVWTIANAE